MDNVDKELPQEHSDVKADFENNLRRTQSVSDGTCCICLEDFKAGDKMRVLKEC